LPNASPSTSSSIGESSSSSVTSLMGTILYPALPYCRYSSKYFPTIDGNITCPAHSQHEVTQKIAIKKRHQMVTPCFT
jgi:hypothetical protein